MSAAADLDVSLAQLDGYRVNVTWNKQGEAEPWTREGTVIAASVSGILVKPRGAMLGELIAADEIVSLEILSEQSAKVVRRRLRIMKQTDVRQHLADRHGTPVSVIVKMTDQVCFNEHAQIDHTDLAHFHENREDTALGQALSEDGDDEDS